MVIKCTASTKMRNLNRFKPDYTGVYRIKTCGLFLCIVLFLYFYFFCCIPLLPMATMLSFLQTFPDDRGVKIKINWPKTKCKLPNCLFTFLRDANFHIFSIRENMWWALIFRPFYVPDKKYLFSDIIVLSFVVGTELWVILKCFFWLRT